MVWCGMVCYGMVWYGDGKVRYGTVWYGMVRYGVVQYGWYGTVWSVTTPRRRVAWRPVTHHTTQHCWRKDKQSHCGQVWK